MPPRSRTKPGSTTRRPKVAGLRQHAHAGAPVAPGVDDDDVDPAVADTTDTTDATEAPEAVSGDTETAALAASTGVMPDGDAESADTADPADTAGPVAEADATTGTPDAPETTELPAAATTPAATPAATPDGVEEVPEGSASAEATETSAAGDSATDTDTATDTATDSATDDVTDDVTDAQGAVAAPKAKRRRRTGMTPGGSGAAASASAPTRTGPGTTEKTEKARPARKVDVTPERRERRRAAATEAARTRGKRTAAAAPSRWEKLTAAFGRFAASRALPVTLVVVIVVCLVLAGLAFWQGRKAWTDGPVANQAVVDVGGTAELVGQSREAVEKIFSYDFTRLDESVDAARSMSTGQFTDRYLQVFDSTIRQPATEQQLKQTATVVNIGVTQLRGDRAEVMALVQFNAQRQTTGQSTNAPGLLRLEMQRVDGRWKLAELTPRTGNG